MTIQELRDKNWIIFEAISGSRAYGTDVETSDTDIRGIYVQPASEILGYKRYIPQVSDKDNDVVFYEIGRFLELAANGSPGHLELLNVDDDCVIYKHKYYDEIFTPAFKDKFITMKLKHSFTGYAYSQIQKARGLNKKINWDESKMTRKDVLDFCYVLGVKENSMKFKHWASRYLWDKYGLAKVNNFPDMYSMYYMETGGGIVSEDSNDVQLRSIPKDAKFVSYLRFDRNAYSQHCKDYREYEKWVQERNPQRYKDNLKGEQGYDHKNMMHCMRLLQMAEDIADGKGIVVKRPNREYLLQIRNGEMPYNDLLHNAEQLVEIIKDKFDQTDLPKGVNPKLIDRVIRTVRLENLHNARIY